MSTRSIVGTLTAAAVAALFPCALLLAAPEGPPTPPAEMSNLKKTFDGSWTCEGKAEATPFGPAGAMKGTVKSHTDMGGFWQSGMVKSTMAGMPGAMEGMFHMTYDPGAKQYVLLWVDNMGAYSQSTATGWQGDKVVFTGQMSMGGKKMATRDTFVKAADGSLKHDWEGEIDSKWMAMGSETCRKAAGGAPTN